MPRFGTPQVSQYGICAVDTADDTFDEVVVRAQNAAKRASFYGYYDPVECDRMLDETAACRGQSLDISWYWDRKQPTFDGTLYIQADSGPMLADRQALAEGLPAVYLEVWTDTHHFALAQVEEFVREMEAVVVVAISWRFS
jgi:hypothetical protein